MSTPIGRTGLARIGNDQVNAVTFTANTSVTKVTGLDPTKTHDIFFSVAGPSDVTLAFTSDDPQAVAGDYAVYGADKVYTTVSAAGYGGAVAPGVTAVKVTHAKNGAGTDVALTVATLGGRFQARFVEKVAVGQAVADADQGTYGDYTALV